MARRSDHTILADSNVKTEELSSIKRGLTAETPEPKKARKASYKMFHQHGNNGLGQADEEASGSAVKPEEALFFPQEHESKSLRAMIPVTEGQKYHGREDILSFNVLESGQIYFFYRSRVDVLEARGIHDIARSFIVLRPSSPEATSGKSNSSMEFGKTFRLLVVPKKVLPKSGRIKEMGFVEKSGITLKELDRTFIAGREYETQTYGARTTPDAKLYAKGVYAITSAQRSSYLSYILTSPKILGPVQEDLGLRARGSWLVQSKNPKLSSPSSVSLPNSPEYPESFGDIFGYYRWVPLQPKLIEYPNAQFLLIGRSNKEASSIVPEGRQEDRMRADEQLEEIAHWNDEKDTHFLGVDPVYGDLGLHVLHFDEISTAWAR